jgi:LPXTG-site transpeptidase (sortase) family protein
MTISTFNRTTILRLCLVFAIAAGMASFPGQGVHAAIDLSSFAAKVDFGTGVNTYGVAIGDLDGEGNPELVVANYGASTISVLRNTSMGGNISFAAKVDFNTGGTHPMGVTISDIDGDNKPDLIVTNYDSDTIAVLRNTSTSGNISFAPRVIFGTGHLPITVAVGDLDGDSKPDLAVSNIFDHTISVLRNTSTSGSISFATKADFAAGTSPYGIAIGDLDGDSKSDLAVSNYDPGSNTAPVLRNTSTPGSLSFAARVNFGTGTYPVSIAMGDLDGDSKPDLAVSNFLGSSISVLRNTSTPGSVSFAAKADFGAGGGPINVAMRDLDGDTKTDLAVVNYNDNTVSVLRNTSTSGSISFATKVDFGTGTHPYGLAIGNLNGDRSPDLAVGNFDSHTVSVLRNTLDTTAPLFLFGVYTGSAQLTVTFNEDVKHEGSAGAANNIDNYLLFEDGANGIFETINCEGGIRGDDTNIVINSASYNVPTFTATLNFNGGVVLPGGAYRLLVCGTTSIEDLAGNKLNDGSADSDFNFSVATIPATGFAPNQVTILLPQTTSYADLGDLWLEIPALGVQTPIVGVPLVNDNWNVSWLEDSAGWLDGSVFPTWAGNSVLTGHVYDAYGRPGPFMGLNRLWWGSQVIVHAWGGQYVYEVRSVTQVSPDDTAAMMKHQELPWLTLVTCRGYDETSNSYKYRMLVRAVLVEVK